LKNWILILPSTTTVISSPVPTEGASSITGCDEIFHIASSDYQDENEEAQQNPPSTAPT
jgi:hypothetical protein